MTEFFKIPPIEIVSESPAGIETILGSLVVDELQRIQMKPEFYGLPMKIYAPEGKSRFEKKSITIDKFLEQCPLPKNPDQIALYGLAWEFIWGKPKPQEIVDAKDGLMTRAKCGLPITEMENIWLNVILLDDTDMF